MDEFQRGFKEGLKSQQVGLVESIFLLLVLIVVVFIFLNMRNRSQLSTDEVNATATTRAVKAEATATAKACEYRQTRQWCASRRDWSVDTEANLSALLKSVGGLDALTAKEQARAQEIENGLAQYRRICEGEGVEANLDSILQEVSMTLKEWTSAGEIEREIARYRSRC